MIEVFKRLGERGRSLLDESHKEMYLPENHWGDAPLFELPKEGK